MSGIQAEGTLRDVAGNAGEAVGGATAEGAAEMRGTAGEAAEQAQTTFGDAVETVRHIASHQPLTALLVAAGVGFAVGMLMPRR